jgi:hypothetical protein
MDLAITSSPYCTVWMIPLAVGMYPMQVQLLADAFSKTPGGNGKVLAEFHTYLFSITAL